MAAKPKPVQGDDIQGHMFPLSDSDREGMTAELVEMHKLIEESENRVENLRLSIKEERKDIQSYAASAALLAKQLRTGTRIV